MISKEQVKHIAKLARLGLQEKEIKKMQKELSSILDYVEKLKEVDVSNVKLALHVLPVQAGEKKLREDKEKKQEDEAVQKLIKAAPETKQGYIRVKKIF